MTIEATDALKLDGQPQRPVLFPAEEAPREQAPEHAARAVPGALGSVRELLARARSYLVVLFKWAEARLKTDPATVRGPRR